jgi:hypothetical protein
VGVYNVSVKAVYGTTESAVATAQVVYMEDDIKLYNMENISFNKLSYQEGQVTFNSTSGLTHRNASTIILKKQYTDELIKVGFTAVGTSIDKITQKIGIGVRGASETSTDSITTGQYSLFLPEFGGNAAINYGQNTAVNYVADGTNSKNIKPYAGIALGSGLVAGQKYYIVTGFVGKGNDAVFHFALLDNSENLLYATYWNYKDIVAFNSKFGAVADSGYYSIYSFQDAANSVTLDYEFITVDELTNKSVVKNATSSSMTESNGVKTYNFTAASNVVETANWREGYSVSIAEPYSSYKNEFIKIGFTPVQCRTDTNDGAKTGLSLDDQRINVVYRAASVLSGGVPSGAWHTVFYNNGATNLKLCYNGDSAGSYVMMSGLNNLDNTKKHYIITGAVTINDVTNFYYIITVENGNGETLLGYATWALATIDTSSYGINESGMFVVNVCTPNQNCITTQILTEKDGLALVDAAQNKVNVLGASSYTTSLTTEGQSVTLTTTDTVSSWNEHEFPNKSTNITTAAKTYDDEFVKVGFTAVGANLADNDIKVALRTTLYVGTSNEYNQPWRWHWGTAFEKDGTIKLAVHQPSAGVASNTQKLHGVYANNPNYLVDGMEVGAKYYIVLGVVNNNDVYFMLYKETANGEELVVSATWDYAKEIENKVVKSGSVDEGTAVYANFENAGNFIISLYTPSVTKTITVDILSATEASALINAIPSAE